MAHPFLAAAYPVLALAAENVEEGVTASDLLVPLILSICLAGISWIVAGMFSRDPRMRGMIALPSVMFLLWYGPVVQFLFPLWNGRPLALHAIALPSWAAILLLLAIWAVRSRRDFRGLSRYLNMSFALLLVFPLVILLKPRDDVGYARLPLETASVSTTPASRPDIYFIILDKYTGSRSLAANFDYDNEPFEDSLRQRGFFVPERSRTNYVHTHLSLASMLNWSHLQPVAEKMGSGSRDRSMTYGMIEDNRA
ncbi:hypothetical protein BH18GEM1_BH18GEM1_12650 [soil metagenome]